AARRPPGRRPPPPPPPRRSPRPPATSLALITRLGVSSRIGFTVEALLAALVVGPGAIALGTIFPSTLALAATADGTVPLGRLLAANTAGGTPRALAAPFPPPPPPPL